MTRKFVLILFFIFLVGCGINTADQVPTPTSPEATNTPVPPTETAVPPTETPIPTNTATPEPTKIPGVVIYPVNTMDNKNPWLPWDAGNAAVVRYYAFNMEVPPFNNVLVRKAFVAAMDRNALFELVVPFTKNTTHPDSYKSASSLTPPSILGLDLYGELGIPYDPVQARAYLAEAGYEDISGFPTVELWVPYGGLTAPGANSRIGDAAAAMWLENLGIEVTVVEIGSGYSQRILESNTAAIFWFGWIADYNDPENFLTELMHSGAYFNAGHYASSDFDDLVEHANLRSVKAPERQLIYLEAERLLIEIDVAIIPLWYNLGVYPE